MDGVEQEFWKYPTGLVEAGEGAAQAARPAQLLPSHTSSIALPVYSRRTIIQGILVSGICSRLPVSIEHPSLETRIQIR